MLTAAIRKESRITVILIGLGIAALLAFLIALSIGQVTIPIGDILQIFSSKIGLTTYESDGVFETVLLKIRFPRLVMTVLIGSALAVSGAALQGLFRNPLVEPGLIGVSSGAAVAVVALIVFGSMIIPDQDTVQMNMLRPMIAFAGGLLATFMVIKIGEQVGKMNIAVLILAGVAVNALAGAIMGLIIFYADENQLRMFTFWTLGDLSGATWGSLLIAAPILILAIVMLLRFQHALNAIALGESEAYHMGVDVEKVKKSIVFFSALAVGVSVSLAGIIGFIGLVIPHLIRVMFHSDNRLVMPASVIGGPLLLILADLASRTLVSPSELPIGVVTALVGAPFFIFLLVRTKRKQELIIQ
ncbi:MAG: iron ABC transporter permease [Cyclobacteriaceae bacterium]|nr:iron ABC transporter permease [Cyclobacteriaceae bacterium]